METQERPKVIDDFIKPWTTHWLKKGEQIGLFNEVPNILNKEEMRRDAREKTTGLILK